MRDINPNEGSLDKFKGYLNTFLLDEFSRGSWPKTLGLLGIQLNDFSDWVEEYGQKRGEDARDEYRRALVKTELEINSKGNTRLHYAKHLVSTSQFWYLYTGESSDLEKIALKLRDDLNNAQLSNEESFEKKHIWSKENHILELNPQQLSVRIGGIYTLIDHDIESMVDGVIDILGNSARKAKDDVLVLSMIKYKKLEKEKRLQKVYK